MHKSKDSYSNIYLTFKHLNFLENLRHKSESKGTDVKHKDQAMRILKMGVQMSDVKEGAKAVIIPIEKQTYVSVFIFVRFLSPNFLRLIL